MRTRLSFDAILAALAVASAGALPACSRAENSIAPETTKPAAAPAATPKSVATSKSAVPVATAASTPHAVDAGVEIAPIQKERRNAGDPRDPKSDQAACAAGACSPDMRKGH